MISRFGTYSIYLLIFLVFVFTQSLKGQPDIDLPGEIQFYINDSEKILTQGWIDSLVDDAFSGKIYYKILGAARSDYYVTTQIQLPQILSLNDVCKQIVLYYTTLPDEDTREREFLNIFPYFEPTEGDPILRCQYKSVGKYYVEVNQWTQIPIPSPPLIEDRDIYNQILQISFHEVQSFGDVSDQVFEKVAIKNGMSIDRIKIIYQNTILWQVGNQMSSNR